MSNAEKYFFKDFTEDSYRYLLRCGKKSYIPIGFPEYRKEGKVILWRHDIDISVHRSLAIASIECDENVKATYHVCLHNEFYNVLEKDIITRLYKILDSGHDLGLHFDPAFYASSINTENDLVNYIIEEKALLEKLVGNPISSFSFHSPLSSGWNDFEQDEVGGMIYAYGKYLKSNFGYCSDSNGYWRFRRMKDVLEEAADEKLHLLTHPGLWTDVPMAPRQRITHCIEGRADFQHQYYDSFLAQCGRTNVRHDDPEFDTLFRDDPKFCKLVESLIHKGLLESAFIELWRRFLKLTRQEERNIFASRQNAEIDHWNTRFRALMSCDEFMTDEELTRGISFVLNRLAAFYATDHPD